MQIATSPQHVTINGDVGMEEPVTATLAMDARTDADLRLRQEHHRFAALAPSLWHSEALTHLRECWEQFNTDFFAGGLTPPYLTLDAPASSRRMGSFETVSGFGGTSQITIRRSILDGSWKHVRAGDQYRAGRLRVVEDILLHEMIHHYHQEVTGRTEDTYHGHGPAFRDECNRIGAVLGLSPVRAQHKRGKDKDRPSCAQWPHNVRLQDPDYYLGAFLRPEERTDGDGSGEVMRRKRRQATCWRGCAMHLSPSSSQ